MMNKRLQKVSGDTFTPTLPFATNNPQKAPSIPEGWSGSEGSGAATAYGSRLPKGSMYGAQRDLKEATTSIY
eukprot:4031566-Prorocentrum_lima.AAC.1